MSPLDSFPGSGFRSNSETDGEQKRDLKTLVKTNLWRYAKDLSPGERGELFHKMPLKNLSPAEAQSVRNDDQARLAFIEKKLAAFPASNGQAASDFLGRASQDFSSFTDQPSNKRGLIGRLSWLYDVAKSAVFLNLGTMSHFHETKDLLREQGINLSSRYTNDPETIAALEEVNNVYRVARKGKDYLYRDFIRDFAGYLRNEVGVTDLSVDQFAKYVSSYEKKKG